MKKQKHIYIFTILVCAGFAAFTQYAWLGMTFHGWGYPQNSFLFLPGDRYMDFFSINEMVAGMNPYAQGSSYPPFALLAAVLFARAIPGTGVIGRFEVRDQEPLGYAFLVAMYAVCIAVSAILFGCKLYKNLTKNKKNSVRETEMGVLSFRQRCARFFSSPLLLQVLLPAVLFFAAFVFAAPTMYAFDRGNYIILCAFFLLLFAFFFEDHPVLSAVFLAVAACLKIYPVALFLVFFVGRKFKAMFAGLAVGGGLSLASGLLFQGPLMGNVRAFLQNLLNFTNGLLMTHYFYYQNAIGVRTIVATPILFMYNTIPESINIYRIGMVVSLLLLLWTVVICFLDRNAERQILYITLFMILFPTPSFYYNLIFLMLPVFMILTRAERRSYDFWVLGVLLLLLIPKNYKYLIFYFEIYPVQISVGHMIDAYMLLGLFIGVSVYALKERSRMKRSV